MATVYFCLENIRFDSGVTLELRNDGTICAMAADSVQMGNSEFKYAIIDGVDYDNQDCDNEVICHVKYNGGYVTVSNGKNDVKLQATNCYLQALPPFVSLIQDMPYLTLACDMELQQANDLVDFICLHCWPLVDDEEGGE